MGDDTAAQRDELRERAILEMERLLAAAEVLREDLDGHVAVCRAIIDGIRREDDLAAVMDRADSRTWRPRLTDALTNYERLRHKARLRLIALGAAEGMTVADVQERWSITKQLANRSIREAGQLD